MEKNTEDTYHTVSVESGKRDQFRGDGKGILYDRKKGKTTYYSIELICHLHR